MPLCSPVTATAIECASGRYGRAAAAALQGWRSSYEDAHMLDPDVGIFAVYDGHLGDEAAAFCMERLHLHVAAVIGEASGPPAEDAMRLAFTGADAELRGALPESAEAGTTATLAVVRASDSAEKELTVTVCNCGDSRAVLWRKGESTMESTKDHKPNDPAEKARIEAAGGFVCDDSDPARVDGELACSRALGAFRYKANANLEPDKQKVSPVPDVYQWKAQQGDWLILACDGVWDTFSNERVVEEVCKAADTSDLGKVVSKTLQRCMDREADDNLTLMAVELGTPTCPAERSLTMTPGNFVKIKDQEVLDAYISFCLRFGYDLKKEMVPKKPPIASLTQAAAPVPGPRFASLPSPAPICTPGAPADPPKPDIVSHDMPVKELPPLIVCGPSGAGKGTLIGMLEKEFPGKFGFSVSSTTRAARPGEVDGKHYKFLGREAMQQEIDAGGLIEHAEVHGNLYGTSKEAVEAVRKAGKICILDIDTQGVKQIKEAKPWEHAVYLSIVPPSLEALEARLRARATESEEAIQKRLNNAKGELQYINEKDAFDRCVVNDDLAIAKRDICNAVRDLFPQVLAQEVKISTKRPPSFYIRAAQQSFEQPPCGQAPQELRVSGLGAAVPTVAAVAGALEAQGHKIVDVATSLAGKGKPQPRLSVVIRHRAVAEANA